MGLNIIFIIAGLTVIIIGLYLNQGMFRVSQAEVVIPEEHVTPRKAVKSLPVIDESDTGAMPSEGAELSSLESACIANEIDVSDMSVQESSIKDELTQLGYRFTKTAQPSDNSDLQTVIDAFDDGRCFFPAPETPGLGDDLTPVDNQ